MVVSFGLSVMAFAYAEVQATAPTPPPPTPAQSSPPPSNSTAPNSVEGVVVSAPSTDGVRASIDRRSYSLSGDLQATTGSIGDALGNLPSVEVDTQGNLSLRGDSNVTILVDGKPSGLFKGAGRAAALQQLPASQYARVEIITNPSAAFDANGSGGIINLISKKTKGAGRTGTLQASASNKSDASASAAIGYNTGKLSLNADLSAQRDVRTIRISNHRVLSGGVESDNVRRARPVTETVTAHVSADYDLDPRTKLSAEAHAMEMDFTSHPTDDFVVRSPVGERRSAREGRRTNWVHDDEIDTQLVRRFSGEDHDLTIAAVRGSTINKDRQPFAYSLGAPSTGAYEAFDFDQHQTLTRLSVDYRKPLPKDAKLTAGGQVEDDGYLYENSGARGANAAMATLDPGLTNRFRYGRVVSAAYATAERPFGKLTAQIGLRVEHARVRTEQLTLGGVRRNSETRAFPSLYLDYGLDDKTRLRASYAERIERPDPDDLNPFPSRDGALAVTAGNPNLGPELTRSYEVSYEYRDGPTYRLATLFLRDIRDTVTDIVTPLDGGVLLSTKENLGRKRSAGLELSSGGRLAPKLTYTLSATATYVEIDPTSLAVGPKRSAVLIGGKLNLNSQITADDLLQFNLVIRARRLTPQGYGLPYGRLNLGYRRKINDRLFLVASMRDVFKTGWRVRDFIDQPGLMQRGEYVYDPHRITVGFSYALGGKAKKAPSLDYGS
ncbi:outer membrane beta-barrel family protein [uncultured Caulobacter sp.]|uniref:outer membrane beta-barrel family protein n=1 Tax=uncultured Caulobacter sp. TaxID=158749 RepID=UPI00262D56EC|nr:outer membrane beta-barrel family protein [uncultured Caulobacter sp.]